MKLRQLHAGSATDFILLREELSPKQQEGLSYVQMMVARQGKDPTQFVSDVRKLLDPDSSRRAGARESVQKWLQGADPKDFRDGRFFGRKVRVTVLEAIVRDTMLTESRFRQIGAKILSTLADMIKNEGDDSEAVERDLGEFPQLAILQRYAKRAKSYIFDDEKFWSEVERAMASAAAYHQMESPSAAMVRRQLKDTYEHVANTAPEEKEEGKEPVVAAESRKRGSIFTEMVVMEMGSISGVLGKLGIKPEVVADLMQRHEVEDTQYDIERLRSAGKTVQELPGRAAKAVKGAVKGAMTKAVSAVKDISGDVREANREFANEVIKQAAFLLRVKREETEQGPEEPEAPPPEEKKQEKLPMGPETKPPSPKIGKGQFARKTATFKAGAGI